MENFKDFKKLKEHSFKWKSPRDELWQLVIGFKKKRISDFRKEVISKGYDVTKIEVKRL